MNTACSLVIVLEVRLVKPNGDSENQDYETNGMYTSSLIKPLPVLDTTTESRSPCFVACG